MLNKETLSNTILRPTHVTVDLSAIAHNYWAIKKLVGDRKVMFVLKANAYGHGLVRIAQHLEGLGSDYFGVAYLEEGMMLREAGIKTPILVLGGIIGNQIPLFLNYDLTMTASSVFKLKQIEQTAEEMNVRAKAHLKIDTGMERIGTHYYSAQSLLHAGNKCRHTVIEGIFSHLAMADEEDESFTRLQTQRFDKVLEFYGENNIDRPVTHIANSGALLQHKHLYYDMVRIGLLLFGIYPAEHLEASLDLVPALNWKSRIVYFKVVKPGHPVSYGGTWTPDAETRVVTLPVGYGDGYMRSMSNKAEVLIRGQRYPVVGTICMDQMMVNIGDGTAYNDDEVVLIGKQGEEEIKVSSLAGWAGTIPYEILTNINTRVPRIYIGSE